MSVQSQHLESIEDIKQFMQKSSRFISLSGLSGIAAGICAIIAAWVAHNKISQFQIENHIANASNGEVIIFHQGYRELEIQLILVGLITFIVAFWLAFLFTYIRSRKTGVPIWGYVARKVMINVAIPMLVGGLFIWRMKDLGLYGLIAPACLLFYGLALINSSKYTFPEIRYLGFGQLILGVANLWLPGYGLYFWAFGFGVLHVIYGFVMWWKNERQQPAE